MKNIKIATSESATKTAWAVNCPECGNVYMTQEFYKEQMNCADSPWLCPRCFTNADFDNDNWERAIAQPFQDKKECQNCHGTGVDKGTKCLCQE